MRLVDVIGDVFSERQTTLSERERALITDILEKLVADFEMSVRRELSERLADKPAAPSELVALLANDEIAVARPILMRSRVLQDRELIAIVRDRGRQHQLAVARRRTVSEPVADALIETDDDDVIGTLLRNQNARIAEATMAYLVDQARKRDSFLEPLVGRTDLPPHLVRRLYLMVSAALRQRILAQYEVETAELDDLLEEVATAAPEADAHTGENGAAHRLAERIAQDRPIDGALLVKVLRQGELALFEALFGRLSGIRPPRLQHVLYETGGRGLAAVCKALEIDKAAFTPIYLLSRKGGGARAADPSEVHRVVAFFDGLKPEAAEKALRHWRRDPAYLDALDALEEDRRLATAGRA